MANNNGDKKKKLMAQFQAGFGIKQQGFVKPQKQALIDQFSAFQQQPSTQPIKAETIFGDTLGQQEREPIKPAELKEQGFLDAISSLGSQISKKFTGEERRTVETDTLPELGTIIRDPSIAKKVSGALFVTSSPQEQADILEKNIEGFTQRTDDKGNIIVKFPDGKEEIVNRPGFSEADALNIFNEAIQFFPAAKLAGFGRTALRKIGLGGLLSGATQTGKELTQEQFGGEFNAEEIAFATAAGIVGEAIPAFIRKRRQTSQAKKLGSESDAIAETAESVRSAEEATKATGVELFPAQKTLVPSTLEKQSFVATLPAAQRTSLKALKTQNKQAGEAVETFLNDIAKADVVQTGAERFRTAAQKAVEAQKAIRSEKTSTLFNEAFRSDVKVSLKPVRDLIKDKIKDFPSGGEVQNSLNKISNLITGRPSLRKLQNAKLEIDQMIAKVGENSLGNTTKREVIAIKKALLDQMDEASPIFKEARELFASASPAVNELEQSILGKITKLDDTQLKSVSKMIFDPEQANVKSVLDAKKVIDSVDPDAWNGLVRVELERRIGAMRAGVLEGAGETVENIPAALNRAIFGNEKQARILKNALTIEQKKNLNYLQTVLKRAGTGRIGGSQTAGREEIKKELKGGLLDFFSKIFTPLESAKGGISDLTFDKNVKNMAIALFDTKWQPQLSKIRKINPNTPEAARLWTQLLNDIENEKEVK